MSDLVSYFILKLLCILSSVFGSFRAWALWTLVDDLLLWLMNIFGGVYRRKLTPGASFIPGWLFCFVSRLHYDWVISYLVIHIRFKIANVTGRPISHQNGWSFRVYMIPLRDFIPEWNSLPGTRTGVNSRRGDSHRHDILWWYHVNKYSAIRGNRSELALGQMSPWCHVNTPFVHADKRNNLKMMVDICYWSIETWTKQWLYCLYHLMVKSIVLWRGDQYIFWILEK